VVAPARQQAKLLAADRAEPRLSDLDRAVAAC
jgi:hypothetical protein